MRLMSHALMLRRPPALSSRFPRDIFSRCLVDYARDLVSLALDRDLVALDRDLVAGVARKPLTSVAWTGPRIGRGGRGGGGAISLGAGAVASVVPIASRDTLVSSACACRAVVKGCASTGSRLHRPSSWCISELPCHPIPIPTTDCLLDVDKVLLNRR